MDAHLIDENICSCGFKNLPRLTLWVTGSCIEFGSDSKATHSWLLWWSMHWTTKEGRQDLKTGEVKHGILQERFSPKRELREWPVLSVSLWMESHNPQELGAQRSVGLLAREHSSGALSGKTCASRLLRLPLEEISVTHSGVSIPIRPDDTDQRMVTP